MKRIYTLLLITVISIKSFAAGCTNPIVTLDPINTVVCVTANTSFSIAATGPSLVYQWQVDQGAGFINLSNVAPYSGVTTSVLSITGATMGLNNYLYRCFVTNGCAPNDTSAAALLKIDGPPVITIPPSNLTTCEGSTASFGITTSGSGLTYQWQVNDGSGFINVPSGLPYSGETSATLFITGVTTTFSGYLYQCIVTGGCAPSVTSASAILTINTLPNVTVQPNFVEVCEGNNTNINITAIGTALTYQWQVNSGTGYSNLTNGAPYAGVTTNSLSISGALATMNGYLYQCVVSGACVPADSSYEIALIVHPTTSQFTNATICQGDTLAFGSSNLTSPGFYSNTFTSIYGCDSVVYLSLNVNSAYFTTTTSVICNGDSISIGGIFQSTAGVYTYVLPTVNGCDSTIANTLTVKPSYNFYQSTIICAGDSALIFGSYETVDSIYTDNYTTVLGCDSIYSHELIVKPTYDITIMANICNGDSILIGGIYESTPGTFSYTYSSIYGCDSIVKTTLNVHPLYNLTQSLTICSNDSVFLAGAYQNTAGVYTDSLTSSYGCDSVVVTTLAVNTAPIVTLSFPTFFCHWDPPTILTQGSPSGGTYSGIGITGGNTFTVPGLTSGTYEITYTYIDSSGCSVSASDSLIVVICSGVNDIDSNPDFEIYPNPFADNLTIDSYANETGKLQVLNVLGQVVYSQKITKGKTTINFSELSSGIYFIQNTVGEKTNTQKLIKK